MTDQPRTPPTATIRKPDGGITVTWTPRSPQPYDSVFFRRRGQCSVCTDESLWAAMNEPLLCAHHHDLAAYAALPWWRRVITRKPKP